jgi:hypothetical protein
MKPEFRAFVYRGGAVGFGGQMTHPTAEAPPAQASTTLPPVGGYASASVHDYVYRHEDDDLVSFRLATSQVVGSADPEGRIFSTQVSVRVEGLRILTDLVTADTIVGRLTSRQPPDLPPAPISMPVEGQIWNLRIKGRPVTPRMHALLRDDNSTKAEVDQICGRLRFDGKPAQPGDPTVLSIFDDESLPTERQFKFEDDALTRRQQVKDASLTPGWCIVVPNFGRIFLGELLVFEDHRVLMMMRIVMGSPRKGVLVLGAVEGNGRPS